MKRATKEILNRAKHLADEVTHADELYFNPKEMIDTYTSIMVGYLHSAEIVEGKGSPHYSFQIDEKGRCMVGYYMLNEQANGTVWIEL